MRPRFRWLLATLLPAVLVACEPISEPWVSGDQAEALADERARDEAQKDELRDRLERYGGAYE